MIVTAKFTSPAEISPLDQRDIFQTCLPYVYIWMPQDHFKFNMSKLLTLKIFQKTFSPLFFLISFKGTIITQEWFDYYSITWSNQKSEIHSWFFSLSHPQNQIYWQLISVFTKYALNPPLLLIITCIIVFSETILFHQDGSYSSLIGLSHLLHYDPFSS